MGIIRNDALKGFSGKIGNMVVYERAGKVCVRTLTVSRASIGQKQREQQERIASLGVLFRALKAVGMADWWRLADLPQGWTGYNLFVKRNVQAFTAEGIVGDFAKVKLTEGRLPLPDGLVLQRGEKSDEWVLEWEQRESYPGGSEDDRVCIALLKREDCFEVVTFDTGGKRADWKVTFCLPERWKGFRSMYCYLCSGDGKAVSDSRYLHKFN